VVTEDKQGMARGPELALLAERHGLPMVTIADLVRFQLSETRLVEPITKARVPTRHGDFTCHAWRSRTDGAEHLAFSIGDVANGEPVLVRVHSECLTGDVFGSQRCDCGGQLEDALRLVGQEGRGVVVYLRGHEGRGVGLAHKLEAYNLQDRGRDTVEANIELGLPVDRRDYGIGAQILLDLGVRRIRLLTNNPRKLSGLDRYGLELVERVPLPPRRTAENLAYLEGKRLRMGHLFSDAGQPLAS
jgi:3,4-dihydroxy 2-butanone 4-phosphate synthase/GTP cyclohydrolase II